MSTAQIKEAPAAAGKAILFPPNAAKPAYNNPLPLDYHKVNGLAGPKSPAPHGEKQWQQWAQDLEDFSIETTAKANTRIPYMSTAQKQKQPKDKTHLQMEAQLAPYPPTAALPLYNSPHLPPAYPVVNGIPAWKAPLKGEKQWQKWAQDLVDWEDNQMTVANGRIPYQSAV